jgi:hypothetical protein
MKRWIWRLVAVLVLAGLGFFGWQVLHPSPEKVIRERMKEVARLASVQPNESQLARLANAQKLTSFLTHDVEISVELPGHSRQSWNGIDEVREAVVAAEANIRALKVEFPGVQVTVGPDKKTAFVALTAEGTIPGERDINLQELQVSLKKSDNEWLIKKVETVRSLR